LLPPAAMTTARLLDEAEVLLRSRKELWSSVLQLYSQLDCNSDPKEPFVTPAGLQLSMARDKRFRVLAPEGGGSGLVRPRSLAFQKAVAAVLRYQVDGWLRADALQALLKQRLGRPVELAEVLDELWADAERFEALPWDDGHVWARATYRHVPRPPPTPPPPPPPPGLTTPRWH
jgi:hypothetical protein